MKISNKQVMAVFVLGIALLLAAFWAGLNVVKQDTIPTLSQSDKGEERAQPAGKNLRQEPAPSHTDDQAERGSAGYVLQVAGFGTQEKASQMVSDLRRKYKSAHTQSPSGDDTIYRVLIGPYATRQEADQIANELVSQGTKGIMIIPWPQK